MQYLCRSKSGKRVRGSRPSEYAVEYFHRLHRITLRRPEIKLDFGRAYLIFDATGKHVATTRVLSKGHVYVFLEPHGTSMGDGHMTYKVFWAIIHNRRYTVKRDLVG